MSAAFSLSLRQRRHVALLAVLALSACAGGAGEKRAVDLWNGRDLAGWDVVLKEPATAGGPVAHAEPDGVLVVEGRPVGYLATQESFADYELTLEWRWTGKPGNSGVLLHVGPAAQDKVWPRCVQVQTKQGAAGELIPMEGFTFAEPYPAGAKGLPRRAGAEDAAPGGWNALRIVCRGDTIECWLNGAPANHATKCSASSGRIGIQLEGAPFEIRTLALRRR